MFLIGKSKNNIYLLLLVLWYIKQFQLLFISSRENLFLSQVSGFPWGSQFLPTSLFNVQILTKTCFMMRYPLLDEMLYVFFTVLISTKLQRKKAIPRIMTMILAKPWPGISIANWHLYSANQILTKNLHFDLTTLLVILVLLCNNHGNLIFCQNFAHSQRMFTEIAWT